VILGFFVGKSHNMIGHGIFHGDYDFFDLHEKSLYLLYYEIFPKQKQCGKSILDQEYNIPQKFKTKKE